MTRGERTAAVKLGVEAPRPRGNEYFREWRANNPDKVKAAKRRHRYRDCDAFRAKDAEAKRLRRLGRSNPETRVYVGVLATDPCSYCGGPAGQTDHIVPLSKGGENHWTNYTAACGPCNARKKDRSLLAHLLRSAA